MPDCASRYAALDIGSNSVRMQALEVVTGGPPRILASEREVARLGESVFRTGQVSEPALEALCGMLLRMGVICRVQGVATMRAVATAALRDAANQEEFVDRASAALGWQIEIISGEEEARLIHAGVRMRWPGLAGRCLIVDVGGGSTEVIFSEDGTLEASYSLPLGALRLQERFLRGDPPSAKELRLLAGHIESELEPVRRRMAELPVDLVIGTSATAAAVVSAANGIPRERREDSDRVAASLLRVREIYGRLSRMDWNARREIPGIGAQRAEIIIPGAAVLLQVVELSGADAVHYSVAGVRDGILAEFMTTPDR